LRLAGSFHDLWPGSLLIIAIIVATIYSFRMLLPRQPKRQLIGVQSAAESRNNLERNELSGERQREIAT